MKKVKKMCEWCYSKDNEGNIIIDTAFVIDSFEIARIEGDYIDKRYIFEDYSCIDVRYTKEKDYIINQERV